MRNILVFLGLPMVYLGVTILLLCLIFSLSQHTWLLFLGLSFILAGSGAWIWKEKKRSRY